MKTCATFLVSFIAACSFAVVATAGNAVAHEVTAENPVPVKKGLLPDGGSYLLYEVACDNGEAAMVASLDSRSRWCSANNGDLICSRRQEGARERACSSDALASNAKGAVDVDAAALN